MMELVRQGSDGGKMADYFRPNYDYEILARCEFGVLDRCNRIFQCGKPACYKIWWKDDASDAKLFCQKHFEEIRRDNKAG